MAVVLSDTRTSTFIPPAASAFRTGGKRTVRLLQARVSRSTKQLGSREAVVKANVGNCSWLGTLNKTVRELRSWCGDIQTQHGCTYGNIFLVTERSSPVVIFKFKAAKRVSVCRWQKMDSRKHSGMKDAGCPGEWALRVLLCLLCIALAGVCPAAVVCLLTRQGCPASLVVPPVVFLGFLPKKM